MLHLLHIALTVVCVAAFPGLLIAMAFQSRDAIRYYNIYLRQHGHEELPTGNFSSRDSSQHVLFCPLPDDMSANIRGYIVAYRFWTALFFVNLVVLLVVFH